MPALRISTFKLIINVVLLVLIFSNCKNEDHSKTVINNRLEAKHGPSDYFFTQRAYPDKTLDIEAYEAALFTAMQEAAQKDGTGFNDEWTTQGPGNIGARVNAIALHPTNEDIIFAGFSHGGLWKTSNGGSEWLPVFDEQPYLAISAIAFDPSNPAHIWVGTGDENISGYPFIGDGIYKSEDGGETWTHKGLTAQRIVTSIIVDPTDNNRIYAATMGIPFERNNDRGLYRTTDGGDNWEQILFVSDQAGIIDMVIDPFDAQTIYASGWDRIRNNGESLIAGPGAKIYKTTDGGDNWAMLEGGLPTEDLGRTGLAISQVTPGLVYAMYVGTNSQLFSIMKTTDGGDTWNPIPTSEDENFLSSSALGGFGWYFGKVRVNPTNDDDIFLLGVDLWRTLDGGQNWFQSAPPWWQYDVHADKHDLQFSQSGFAYLGTDGGMYRSNATGDGWDDIENIPTTQFYRVAYNPHNPDFYYGGAQDNGTTGGNMETINEWERIFGGDGFQAIFHPFTPDIFYVETQNGNISMTQDGGQSYDPADEGIDFSDRRNWDMPYIMDPTNVANFYAGTYRVYKSTAGVVPFYEPISDILTDTVGPAPDAGRYHTITTINKSAINDQILYVGTTDGNVWNTLDDGGSWNEITNDLPNRYVTDVKASPTFENGVYVSHSGYKDGEDIPHLHYSTDNGNTWTNLSANLPQLAINDIYILPNHQDSIIFVGTDGGVYATLDSGENWERMGSNMPFIPIYDLEYNPVKNEIFAGTFARSIMSYSIDSLLFVEPQDTVIINTNEVFAKAKPTLKIYPSPAVDDISIAFYNSEFGKQSELVILDVSGKVVLQKTFQQDGEVVEQMNVSELISGTYFVKVKTRHTIRSGQFIKN
jgi:photosystem II stability/assembly factor-like uncharacterized protein